MSPQQQPLDGILVLDLGQIYNGPYCGLLLGFMGARVIKIEPPAGDTNRRGRKAADVRSSFLRLNSNKESIVIDLKREEGREVFIRFVKKADVLVENFKVGVMDRLNLGWEALHAVNPRLIYASSTGFGLTGPYRDFPAMDLTVQAMSGILSSTGYAELPPVKCGAAITDFLGGIHLCAGVLAALLQRVKTGEGQQVEVSMHEAAAVTLNTALGALLDHGAGVFPERTGNHVANLSQAPYNIYAAKDGYVTIFCVTDRHWQWLAHLMENPALADDPRFATAAERSKRMEETDRIVGEWALQRTRAELTELLNKAGIPCAPVKTLPEVADDPHLIERGAEVRIPHPDKGTAQLMTSPIRMHGSRGRGIERLAPELGADTDNILREFLEMNADDLRTLHALGVIDAEKT